MVLPEFNEAGDLPSGIYREPLEEVIARFETGTPERVEIAHRLSQIYETANRTGNLSSVLIFGSFVTSKPAPHDVDVVLIMQDNFRIENQPEDIAPLFDHAVMENSFGASVFWVRPAMLMEPLETFRAGWQRSARHCGGKPMINDDEELKATQERITYFQNLLVQFRQTARPKEFLSVTQGYRSEIEQMQKEVLDYLTRPVNLPAKAA